MSIVEEVGRRRALTQGAQTGLQARHALEASRAAVLAAHTAVGLMWPIDRDAARLLRSSEALARTAVAALAARLARDRAQQGPAVSLDPAAGEAAAAVAVEGSSKSSRRRRRQQTAAAGGQGSDEAMVSEGKGTSRAARRRAKQRSDAAVKEASMRVDAEGARGSVSAASAPAAARQVVGYLDGIDAKPIAELVGLGFIACDEAEGAGASGGCGSVAAVSAVDLFGGSAAGPAPSAASHFVQRKAFLTSMIGGYTLSEAMLMSKAEGLPTSGGVVKLRARLIAHMVNMYK